MQKVKILKRVGRQLYRSSPTILTVVASIGVIATTITAVQATPKAIKLLKEAELEKGENLTKLEIVRVAGPTYIPSVLLGVSTIACIFGANALNQKKQASLMSAYAVSYTHLSKFISVNTIGCMEMKDGYCSETFPSFTIISFIDVYKSQS